MATEGQALPTVVFHSVFLTLLTKISIVQGAFLFNRAAYLLDSTVFEKSLIPQWKYETVDLEANMNHVRTT